MTTINISGAHSWNDKKPQKSLWYQDLIIILFLIAMLYYMVFGEVQII